MIRAMCRQPVALGKDSALPVKTRRIGQYGRLQIKVVVPQARENGMSISLE